MSERDQHPHDDTFHKGYEPDYAIVLSSDIGSFPAGSSLPDVLVALDALITALESRRSFTADAKIV